MLSADSNEGVGERSVVLYLFFRAVSACVPAQSSMDRGNCSLLSPSPSLRMSKLRHGAPEHKQQDKLTPEIPHGGSVNFNGINVDSASFPS